MPVKINQPRDITDTRRAMRDEADRLAERQTGADGEQCCQAKQLRREADGYAFNQPQAPKSK